MNRPAPNPARPRSFVRPGPTFGPSRARPLAPSPSPVSLRVLAALGFVVVALAAPEASAQSRFGLELDFGGQFPLSPSVRSVVSLDSETDVGQQAVGVPRLADRLNRPGFALGATALVSTLEIRYRFERFAWRGARVRCVGDRQAQQLPNGEIDDAEVRYDCGVQAFDVTLPGEDGSALGMHHLSVGPRFYLRRDARTTIRDGEVVERNRARIYGLPFAGFTLAQQQDPGLGPQLRAGVNLGAGGGLEFPLDRRVALALDARYTLSMVGGSSSPNARAGRAIAAERNVLGALMDVYHRVGLNLGIRIDFR